MPFYAVIIDKTIQIHYANILIDIISDVVNTSNEFFVHIHTQNGYTFGAISFAFITFINLIEKFQFFSGKIDE